MADARLSPVSGSPVARRRADMLGVVMSLLFVAVGSIGIAGDPWLFFNGAVRWGVAGAVLLVGLLLVLSALPRRSGR